MLTLQDTAVLVITEAYMSDHYASSNATHRNPTSTQIVSKQLLFGHCEPVYPYVLEALVLRYAPLVTDAMLLPLCGSHIKTLNLQALKCLTNSGIVNAIESCTNLNQLRLQLCAEPDSIVNTVARSSTHVVHLNLEGSETLQDHHVQILLSSLKEVTILNLSNCVMITQHCFTFEEPVPTSSKLASLDLSYNLFINSDTVYNLLLFCGATLQHINLISTSVDSCGLLALCGYTLSAVHHIHSLQQYISKTCSNNQLSVLCRELRLRELVTQVLELAVLHCNTGTALLHGTNDAESGDSSSLPWLEVDGTVLQDIENVTGTAETSDCDNTDLAPCDSVCDMYCDVAKSRFDESNDTLCERNGVDTDKNTHMGVNNDIIADSEKNSTHYEELKAREVKEVEMCNFTKHVEDIGDKMAVLSASTTNEKSTAVIVDEGIKLESDASIQHLSKHCTPMLRSLELENTEFSTYALVCYGLLLTHNHQLTRLVLSGIHKHKEPALWLYATAELAVQLKHFKLLQCENVETEDIKVLTSSLPDLESFHLPSYSFFRDDGLVSWLSRGTVHSLDLSACVGAVTKQLLTELAIHQAKSLKYLDISWCEQATVDGIAHLTGSCHALESLVMRQVPLSTQCLLDLSAATRLHTLNVSGVQHVDNNVLIQWSKSLKLLSNLDVSWNLDISDAGVAAILAECFNLKCLELSGLKRLTSEPLLPIIAHDTQEMQTPAVCDSIAQTYVTSHRSTSYAPKLAYLQLEYCDLVDDDDLQTIVNLCQGSLQVVNYYCEMIEHDLVPYTV